MSPMLGIVFQVASGFTWVGELPEDTEGEFQGVSGEVCAGEVCSRVRGWLGVQEGCDMLVQSIKLLS